MQDQKTNPNPTPYQRKDPKPRGPWEKNSQSKDQEQSQSGNTTVLTTKLEDLSVIKIPIKVKKRGNGYILINSTK